MKDPKPPKLHLGSDPPLTPWQQELWEILMRQTAGAKPNATLAHSSQSEGGYLVGTVHVNGTKAKELRARAREERPGKGQP